MATNKSSNLAENHSDRIFENRSIRRTLRLTPSEDRRLFQEYEETGLSKYTKYLRQKLLAEGAQKKIIDRQQQKRMLHEMAQLRTSTSKIGTNFNQLLTAINTFKMVHLTASELSTIEQVGRQMEDVKVLLEQLIQQETDSH